MRPLILAISIMPLLGPLSFGQESLATWPQFRGPNGVCVADDTPIPLTFLGTSEEALFILALVDAGVATFSHANTRLRLGPLNYLVVGPEMHRWHHAANDTDSRTNFGNNLSIFDWIFGTGRLHDGAQPTSLGCGDPQYPEGNLLRQFAYAFRPFPAPTNERAESVGDVEASSGS